MPHMYKWDLNYVWYLGAEDGQRRENLPGFEIDGNRVLIAPGELFCRFVGQDGRQCSLRGRFKGWYHLRKHVKAVHKLEVAPGRSGQLTGWEEQWICEFYDRLKRIASGELCSLSTPYMDTEGERLRLNAKGPALDTFDNLANDTQEANTEIDTHEGEAQEASKAA